MRKRLMAITLIGAAIASMIGLAVADAQPAARAPQECFYSQDWNGWKASPDSKSIYIRVGVNRIFRLDLSQACTELQMPDVHLVTKLRGSSSICSALDIDLRISDGHGFETPCIVSNITRLSDAEAAALPKKQRP